MKVLLVGANGQVGREIQDLAKKHSFSLIPFGHDILDVSDSKTITNILSLHKNANVLINAAAYTAVDMAEDETEIAYQTNAVGPKNLAIWCYEHEIPLIHISTDYVFSGDRTAPYVETDITSPHSVYGKTKLDGEEFIQTICSKHIILRVSWVFGQYGKNFVKTIVRLANEKETLKIVNDQIGNPTSAADIARVIFEIIKKIPSFKSEYCGVYHYCGKDSVSWYQFAYAIIEEAKKYSPLKVVEILPIDTIDFPTKAKRPKNSVLNCDKIKTVLNISQASWRIYLNDVIKYLVKVRS